MRYYKGWTLRDITIDNDNNLIGYIYDSNNELKRKLVRRSIKEFITEFNYEVDSSVNGLAFLSELEQLCKKHKTRLSSNTGLKVNNKSIYTIVDDEREIVSSVRGIGNQRKYIIGE